MKPFPDGSRVAFFGDSITRLGGGILRVAAQYRALFPERDVRFFNVGISGGGLVAANLYFDGWLAPLKPTHVILAFGVNDAGPLCIAPSAADAAAEAERVSQAAATFREGYLALVRRIEALGASVTVRAITPYDESARSDGAGEPVPGRGAAFRRIAEQIRSIAVERGLACLDDYARMSAYTAEEPLFSADRVHPTDRGHWRIAGTLLEAQGLPVPKFKSQNEVIAESGLGEWFDLSQKVANILSAEWHFVRDETLDTGAKIAKAKTWLETNRDKPMGNPYHPFRVQLVSDYLLNKPREASLRTALDTMK